MSEDDDTKALTDSPAEVETNVDDSPPAEVETNVDDSPPAEVETNVDDSPTETNVNAGFASHLQYEAPNDPGELREIRDGEHLHVHDISFKEQRRVNKKFWFAVAAFSLLAFCVALICMFTVPYKRELKFQTNIIVNEIYREQTYGDNSSYAYGVMRQISVESFSAVLEDSGIDYKSVNWLNIIEDPDGIIVRLFIHVIVNEPVGRQTKEQVDNISIQISNAVNTKLSTTALGSLGTTLFWIQPRKHPKVTLECPDDMTFPTDIGRQDARLLPGSLPQPEVQEINGETPKAYRLTGSVDPSDVFPLGVTVIQYRVIYTSVSNGGAMSTCDFNIDIQDQESPIILCPDDIQRTSSNQVIWSPPIVYDNVSEMEDIIIVSTPVNATEIDTGARVVYQVRDGAGNEAACDFTINV